MEYNIKMFLNEILCNMTLIHLAQDKGKWRALVKMLIDFRVP